MRLDGKQATGTQRSLPERQVMIFSAIQNQQERLAVLGSTQPRVVISTAIGTAGANFGHVRRVVSSNTTKRSCIGDLSRSLRNSLEQPPVKPCCGKRPDEPVARPRDQVCRHYIFKAPVKMIGNFLAHHDLEGLAGTALARIS